MVNTAERLNEQTSDGTKHRDRIAEIKAGLKYGKMEHDEAVDAGKKRPTTGRCSHLDPGGKLVDTLTFDEVASLGEAKTDSQISAALETIRLERDTKRSEEQAKLKEEGVAHERRKTLAAKKLPPWLFSAEGTMSDAQVISEDAEPENDEPEPMIDAEAWARAGNPVAKQVLIKIKGKDVFEEEERSSLLNA